MTINSGQDMTNPDPITHAAGSHPVGTGVGEKVNPTVENAYWRENFSKRPYVKSGRQFSEYQPAYRYGWESREQFAGKKWDDVESELDAGWFKRHGKVGLAWPDAKAAVRDAWDRVEKA